MEEDAPHAMLMLTRFVSLFRVFTIEISLHKKIDNDFVNGCLFGCTQLFQRKTYGTSLILEFLTACNVRVMLPFLQIEKVSGHAILLLATICEKHYHELITSPEEVQLFVNAIKQIKSQRTKLAVDTVINFGRPMRNQKVLAAAMQGLNELLDASTVMLARIAAAEIIATRIFGPPAPGQVLSKQDGIESVLPRHSDREVDDETPTWKFDQSQISNNIISQAVALLNAYRVHGGAIIAVFTMLDNILKYAKTMYAVVWENKCYQTC